MTQLQQKKTYETQFHDIFVKTSHEFLNSWGMQENNLRVAH